MCLPLCVFLKTDLAILAKIFTTLKALFCGKNFSINHCNVFKFFSFQRSPHVLPLAPIKKLTILPIYLICQKISNTKLSCIV
ncbi:hypothetical protein D1109_00815 [Actinobacillus pleuropneumoniae]|nr:hypothetical protein D1109_00815 [Actinobacillus pleuropneumoniae]